MLAVFIVMSLRKPRRNSHTQTLAPQISVYDLLDLLQQPEPSTRKSIYYKVWLLCKVKSMPSSSCAIFLLLQETYDFP